MAPSIPASAPPRSPPPTFSNPSNTTSSTWPASSPRARPTAADFLDELHSPRGASNAGATPPAPYSRNPPARLTQYYQRGVVDWQPPPGGGAHSFQRRLAWDYLGGGLGGSTDLGVELHLTNPNPGEESLAPGVTRSRTPRWRASRSASPPSSHRLGGIASFGFPKTDARRDDHPQAELHTPGRPVDSRIRQYFQSAVLEYHPESPWGPRQAQPAGRHPPRPPLPRGARGGMYRRLRPGSAAGCRRPACNSGLARRGPHGSSTEDVARFLELSLLRVQTDRACGSGFRRPRGRLRRHRLEPRTRRPQHFGLKSPGTQCAGLSRCWRRPARPCPHQGRRRCPRASHLGRLRWPCRWRRSPGVWLPEHVVARRSRRRMPDEAEGGVSVIHPTWPQPSDSTSDRQPTLGAAAVLWSPDPAGLWG